MPGLGAFLNPNSGQGNILTRTALAAIIGGTASAVGGGKFANGAYTAAMQHLFNEETRAFRKLFALGKCQSENGKYGKSKLLFELEEYVNKAGYEMKRDVTLEQLKSAWSSGDYDEIIYYTHGNKDGTVAFDTFIKKGLLAGHDTIEWLTLDKVFDPEAAKVKSLRMICCNYNAVVNPLKATYASHGVSLNTALIFQLYQENGGLVILRGDVFNQANWPKIFR